MTAAGLTRVSSHDDPSPSPSPPPPSPMEAWAQRCRSKVRQLDRTVNLRIPQAHIELIVGRAGTVLRGIQSRTGARVFTRKYQQQRPGQRLFQTLKTRTLNSTFGERVLDDAQVNTALPGIRPEIGHLRHA